MTKDQEMGFVKADFKIGAPSWLTLDAELDRASISYSPDVVAIKNIRIPFNESKEEFTVTISCRVFNATEHPKSEVFIHYENKEIFIRIKINQGLFESFFDYHRDSIFTLTAIYYCEPNSDNSVYATPRSISIKPSE